MQMRLLWISLVLPLFLAACDGHPEDSHSAGPLSITEQAPTRIAGQFEEGGQRLKFSSERSERGGFALDVQLGDATFTMHTDLGTGQTEMGGDGAVLTASQKALFQTLSSQLWEYFSETGEGEAVPLHQQFLVRALSYWAGGPEGYAYETWTQTLSPGLATALTAAAGAPASSTWGGEGIACLRRGSTVTAKYTSRNGRRFSDRVRVGSTARRGYECMGRCGPGCDKWYAASAWCKDCLDHDQCSNVFRASGGASDPNCGDEFAQARDDWLFGVLRGCSG